MNFFLLLPHLFVFLFVKAQHDLEWLAPLIRGKEFKGELKWFLYDAMDMMAEDLVSSFNEMKLVTATQLADALLISPIPLKQNHIDAVRVVYTETYIANSLPTAVEYKAYEELLARLITENRNTF